MAAAATGPGVLRRRSTGNRVGPLPVAGLVVAEVALAVALLLLALAPGLRWVAAAVLVVGLGLALGRRRGRWLTEWVVVGVRFLLRSRTRTAAAPVQQITTAEPAPAREHQLVGAEDARVASLRLLVPDLVVAEGSDHEQQATGLACSGGTWTAAVLVDPVPAIVGPLGARADVPLAPLAACLRDRGVVLDSVAVVSHCYPGSSVLPAGSRVLTAYQEVLGPLPAVARRSTWVVVRLDPRRCPAAVHDRGGGVRGAQRALLGALSRVRGALDVVELPHRVLDLDELLRAGLVTAELAGPTGSPTPEELRLREHWSSVTTGAVHHRSYAVAGWTGARAALSGLGSVRALSTTVSVVLAPDADADAVRVRGLVRVCARDAGELEDVDARLRAAAAAADVALERLSGQQAAAVRAGLPVGGAA
ncbi:type VII secretion protein EccE [Rhodococcus aerolatus]